jgi:hypothetical protein
VINRISPSINGPETVGDSSYHVENTKVISIKETGEHQDLLVRTGIPSQWKPRTILIRLQRNCMNRIGENHNKHEKVPGL